jgi:hypothetical protein
VSSNLVSDRTNHPATAVGNPSLALYYKNVVMKQLILQITVGVLFAILPVKGSLATVLYSAGTPILVVGAGPTNVGGVLTELSDGNESLGVTSGTFLGLAEIADRPYDFVFDAIDASTGTSAQFAVDFVSSTFVGTTDGFGIYLLQVASGSVFALHLQESTGSLFLQNSDLVPFFKMTSSIPEPTPLSLLLAGIAGMCLRRGRPAQPTALRNT